MRTQKFILYIYATIEVQSPVNSTFYLSELVNMLLNGYISRFYETMKVNAQIYYLFFGKIPKTRDEPDKWSACTPSLVKLVCSWQLQLNFGKVWTSVSSKISLFMLIYFVFSYFVKIRDIIWKIFYNILHESVNKKRDNCYLINER